MPRKPDRILERELGGVVAGVDEVGVAPLAGPVVAAAVILPPWRRQPRRLRGLTDSKLLKAEDRQRLCEALVGLAEIGVGAASAAEIDRLNIAAAALLAMQRAVARLGRTPEAALVDGKRAPALPCAVKTVVGGDARCLAVSAASVVAKVARDRIMTRLAVRRPGYGWETNKGYGTDEHYMALLRLGPTPHHRRSFAPVAEPFKVAENLTLRFDGRCGDAAFDPLHVIRLRTDLHAVFEAGGLHIGVLKSVRGAWRFRAMGYDDDGAPQSGAGPAAFADGRAVAAPETASLRRILHVAV